MLLSSGPIRAKIVQSTDLKNFFFLLHSDNELPVSDMQNKLGVTDFVSEITRVENYPDFVKWRT